MVDLDEDIELLSVQVVLDVGSRDLGAVGRRRGRERHEIGVGRALIGDLVEVFLEMGDLVLALDPRVLADDAAHCWRWR